jgi:hypothetical protein
MAISGIMAETMAFNFVPRKAPPGMCNGYFPAGFNIFGGMLENAFIS